MYENRVKQLWKYNNSRQLPVLKRNIKLNQYIWFDVNDKIMLQYLTLTLSTGTKFISPDTYFDELLFK